MTSMVVQKAQTNEAPSLGVGLIHHSVAEEVLASTGCLRETEAAVSVRAVLQPGLHMVPMGTCAALNRLEQSMKVKCSVEETELENDQGRPVQGVVVTCTKCDHKTESFGTGEASIKRCLALMREECPEDEENYYLNEND